MTNETQIEKQTNTGLVLYKILNSLDSEIDVIKKEIGNIQLELKDLTEILEDLQASSLQK